MLAAQLATQILQAHEQGRFVALGTEAIEGFRKAFTTEVQRLSYQQLRQLFGTFEGLDFVETHSIESLPHLLIHRCSERYSIAITRSARCPRPRRQADGPVDQAMAGSDAVHAYRQTSSGVKSQSCVPLRPSSTFLGPTVYGKLAYDRRRKVFLRPQRLPSSSRDVVDPDTIRRCNEAIDHYDDQIEVHERRFEGESKALSQRHPTALE